MTSYSRRAFSALLGAGALSANASARSEAAPAASTGQVRKSFRVWLFSDAHVFADRAVGRSSLAEAIEQTESPNGFGWDIALNLGDMAGGEYTPQDDEGLEVVRQYGALKSHRREQIYDICGNEDRSGLDEPAAWWFRKWIDPLGENTASSQVNRSRRPFPIEGTWERYSFRVGNILFLMMSDINEPTQKLGRGPLGGNPGGVVSCDTFHWWKGMVEDNPSSIIISAHHYVLKGTTVASGPWEGFRKDAHGDWTPYYHGYFPQGSPEGASYLYWVCSRPNSDAFQDVLNSSPGCVDLWLGGHTHTNPDDTYGGRSHIEERWGTTFMNVAPLTAHHSFKRTNAPRSWLLTFIEGSNVATANCYLHNNIFAPQGWFTQFDRTIPLKQPFQLM